MIKLQYNKNDNYFQGLPLVILFQPETNLSEKDSLRLREEGQNLADSLQCPFLDEDWDEIKEGAVIEDSLRALVNSRKRVKIFADSLKIF